MRSAVSVHHGLLPGDDAISSSQSPSHEYLARKPRDSSSYISPQNMSEVKSGRSGRSGLSDTSDTTFGPLPDDQDSKLDMQTLQEHQNKTTKELQELGMSMKTSRLRRWRWGASSDEPLQSP